MRFQLPSIKLIGKMVIALIICVLVGIGLLSLAYTIPVDRIDEHVAESARIFKQEGSYPSLNPGYTEIVDSYTDALMLKESAYKGNESAFQKALLVPRNVLLSASDLYPDREIVQYYDNPNGKQITFTYPRYWHGYLLVLKPLLTRMNYGEIRATNFYVQLALSLLIIGLLIYRKSWKLIPSYVATILMLRPYLTAYSMQHAVVFYVACISTILILIFNNSLLSGDKKWLFFFVVGASTSYFDYLTYPLLTLGIPAITFIYTNKSDKAIADFRIMLNIIICWFAGYALMWASKWLLASLFTDQNVITDAINEVKYWRGGSEEFDMGKARLVAVANTLWYFCKSPYAIYVAILLIVSIVLFIFFNDGIVFTNVLSYIIVAFIPAIWHIFAWRHSLTHQKLFAYKEWAVTLFALLALFSNINIKRKLNKPQ